MLSKTYLSVASSTISIAAADITGKMLLKRRGVQDAENGDGRSRT